MAAAALKDSDGSRFRLFVPFLLHFFCVLCGSLLLALILVLLTLVSHCMSPLLQGAYELELPGSFTSGKVVIAASLEWIDALDPPYYICVWRWENAMEFYSRR